ncbi:hypothetical protein DSUL_20131 [Desulfovibrionales bacterium]
MKFLRCRLYRPLALLAVGLTVIGLSKQLARDREELSKYLGLPLKFWEEIFLQAVVPNGGFFIFPEPVQAAIHGLHNLSLSDYTIRGSFAGNEFYKERLYDGAWPIWPNPNSRYVVLFAKDLDGILGCHSMWEAEGIAIADCPH